MCLIAFWSVSLSLAEMVPIRANNSEMALLEVKHNCNNDKNCNIIILWCKVLCSKIFYFRTLSQTT